MIPRDSLPEKVAYLVLEGKGGWGRPGAAFDALLESVHRFSTERIRTVVFGGGSGLSSILGGDTALAEWAASPFGGLKKVFPSFTVGVCVTDDGGSSGDLLRTIPCIALGDLRRAALSSITAQGILSVHPAGRFEDLEHLAAALQQILNHRFGGGDPRSSVTDPARLLPKGLRDAVPGTLLSYLGACGKAFLRDPRCAPASLAGQCLGNLLLAGSIFSRRRPGDLDRPPTHTDIVDGIQSFARQIGAGPETVFPACSTQGELQVLYQHGVLSSGEEKSARGHSRFPVQRVWAHFVERPRVPATLLRRIEEADLILFAPGSLYTSILPILQLSPIADAVRRNRKALKILGANFWAQRGETDLSLRRRGKEYYVSDLIEAYHHNVPGGIQGLFDAVIVTDLQSIPGDVLRNYALEGKVPIYLDKGRVREMGFEPIEAAVFSERKLRTERVIQHDPEKFARVVKVLCFLHHVQGRTSRAFRLPPTTFVPSKGFPRKGHLCDHWAEARARVSALPSGHGRLREALLDILWKNREILLDHLDRVKGLELVPKRQWQRSTEWDNILGYYDPRDGRIRIHEQLLKGPRSRLEEDLLIALGESLLGKYFRKKSIRAVSKDGERIGKILEVELLPEARRETYFSDRQLKAWLRLARLRPSSRNPEVFRMVINDNEAFTPPGLLFGLLYAWYVDNRFGGIVDYEMSLLRWKFSELIPKPSMDRLRMQEQIEFFRKVVFRQKIPRRAMRPL